MTHRDIEIEYVTSPVLHRRLACPKCRARVRQMHGGHTDNETMALFLLGEPLAWVVVGAGFLIGYVAESLLAICAIWILGGLAWYEWRLRRSTFLCPNCKELCSFAQARAAATMAAPGSP